MKSNFKHTLLFLFIFIITAANAQENIDGKPFIRNNNTAFFTEKGFNIWLPIYSIKLDEGYNYRPVLLMGNWGYNITKKENKGNWWAIVEPQFNPVYLDGKFSEAEFGINVAFRYKYKYKEGLYLYAQLGSGPHYITIMTTRQAHGFIFSDNLAFGLSKNIYKNIMFNAQLRIRHVSNASFAIPNRGMNNGLIVVGITKLIN